MKYLIESISCLTSIIIIVMLTHYVNADRCNRRDPLTNSLEEFDCPRFIDSRRKKFCCGMTGLQGHCCEWSEKTEEEVYSGPNVSKTIFENFLNITLVVLLIMICLILEFCICYCASWLCKRKYKEQVISTQGTQSTQGSQSTQGDHSVNIHHHAYPYAAPQPPYNPSYQLESQFLPQTKLIKQRDKIVANKMIIII